MSEPERTTQVAEVKEEALPAQPETKDLCQGIWRLKTGVVLRVEEDGAILFDPDTDSMSVVNLTASALLQWDRSHIGYERWCEILHTHYHKEPDLEQIRVDVKKFLGAISHFVEPSNGENN